MEVPDGVLLRELEGHTATITLLAVASSGNFAASYGRDQDIHIWNFASGKLLGKIAAGNDITTALVIHPHEQFLISGNYKGEISFWNISTGSRIGQLVGHEKTNHWPGGHPGWETIIELQLGWQAVPVESKHLSVDFACPLAQVGRRFEADR